MKMSDVDIKKLVEAAKAQQNDVTIEATVITGFEKVALDECKEKCNPKNVTFSKGRIYFNVAVSDFEEVLKMRSIDNVFLINEAIGDIKLQRDKDKDLTAIKSIVDDVNWEKTLTTWKKLVGFEGILFPQKSEASVSVDSKVGTLPEFKKEVNIDDGLKSSPEVCDNMKPHEVDEIVNDCKKRLDAFTLASKMKQVKEEVDPKVLKFRATCNRSGEHSFSSMEAAADFGGALHDKFNWTVDLSRFNLNVVLNINAQNCYICSAITPKSLHRRNISHFGSTTLRSTLCYCMMRLAEPQPGDIIVDPLCGGGSIPIEGALSYPSTFHLSGDKDEKAMLRTFANIRHINKSGPPISVDPISWSVKQLPLKNESVDIFVTDMPFGKRSGKKTENLNLYKKSLEEMARVSKIKTGRACILTFDKTSFTRALGSSHLYWKLSRSFGVNQGGLFSTVFLLHRTAHIFSSVAA